MTTLQNDLLEIYNSLVVFSDDTVKSNLPTPIKVWYEKDSRLLVMEQAGVSVRLRFPIYYCLGLEDLYKPTYLLPEDYDYLMTTMQNLINSGELLKDRINISPEDYGFDVYSVNEKELWKGPGIIGSIRFISGLSWWFKYRVKRKYRKVL
jgi:hypothetical protein